MGYFSNGSEGDYYEAQYCARCRHQNDDDGCPVMLAHVLYAYEECNSTSNAARILKMLIPPRRDHPAFNDQCAMFCAKKVTRPSARNTERVERGPRRVG